MEGLNAAASPGVEQCSGVRYAKTCGCFGLRPLSINESFAHVADLTCARAGFADQVSDLPKVLWIAQKDLK